MHKKLNVEQRWSQSLSHKSKQIEYTQKVKNETSQAMFWIGR